ncbi:MAG: OsmC family protein [Bacteroidota bacterium]|jgi:putative redox protein
MALLTAVNTHGDYGLTITDASGNSMQTDISIEQGGTGKGLRPMQSMLAALIGCSTVDIVSILKKQKQSIAELKVEADGERESGKEPSLWQTIHLRFILSGDIDPSKAYRAAALSMEKYCSVAETLRRAGANISFVVEVNGALYQP